VQRSAADTSNTRRSRDNNTIFLQNASGTHTASEIRSSTANAGRSKESASSAGEPSSRASLSASSSIVKVEEQIGAATQLEFAKK